MPVSKNCAHCESKFSDKPSHIKNRKFCSYECSVKYKYNEFLCRNCGNLFRRTKTSKETSVFCSHSCYLIDSKDKIQEPKTCACGCGKNVRVFSDGRKTAYHVGHKIGKYEIYSIPIKINCSFCSKEFIRVKGLVEKIQNNCCSPDCRQKLLLESSKVTFHCSNCQKPFRVTKSRKQCKNKFCSSKCFFAFKVKNNKLKNQPNVKCAYCEKEFFVYPSKFKLNKLFYCSVECRAKNIVGKNNPAFTTGTGRRGDYGDNWKKQRRKAMIRDKKRCVLCHYDHIKPRDLHVHHIIPIANFDGNFEKGNDLSNLITVCNLCHTGIHFNRITLL